MEASHVSRRSFVGIAGSAAALSVAQATTSHRAWAAGDEEYDVVVVGAGASGLAAAAAAGEAGARVVVLEASDAPGGAALISGGHLAMLNKELNATLDRNDAELGSYKGLLASKYYEFGDTLEVLKQQIEEYTANGQEKGRFDSIERMLVDQFTKGHHTDLDGIHATVDFDLMRECLEHNMDVNDWLCEKGGMTILDSIYSTHGNTPDGKGVGLINALTACAENAGAIIECGQRAVRLLMENGTVAGVVAQSANGDEHTWKASRGVVLATGSFSSNSAMCAQYQRIATALDETTPSDNRPTNVGDGIAMALEAGAKLRDMQFVNTILLGANNGCSATEMPLIDGKQQMAVNQACERFADDTRSSTLTAAAGNQFKGLVYYVGDTKMADAMEEGQAGIVADWGERGWLFQADTLEEAADQAGLDPCALAASVERFNNAVERGIDVQCGRKAFNGKVEEPPFVVAKMQVHWHLTLGGLVVDNEARVYTEAGGTVPGLYAAGDIVSGIEGSTHQSGANLTADMYYGRVAGRNAFEQGPDNAVAAPETAEATLEPSVPVELSEEEQALIGALVQLPSGTFVMGSPATERYRDDLEEPLHEVSVASFAVGVSPVTVGQYRAFVEDTQRAEPDTLGKTSFDGGPTWYELGTWNNPFPGRYTPGDNDPVTCVTWDDAKDYAEWLSAKTGRPFRLLTEAEYEYAVRAGTTTAFYTGEYVTRDQANFGRYWGSRTTPAGTFEPNPWGLYDMMGNVWSWLEDDFADQNYEGAPTDGSAWVIEGAPKKAVRGASWNVDGLYLRSANRDGYDPASRLSRLGFRIAMDV